LAFSVSAPLQILYFPDGSTGYAPSLRSAAMVCPGMPPAQWKAEPVRAGLAQLLLTGTPRTRPGQGMQQGCGEMSGRGNPAWVSERWSQERCRLLSEILTTLLNPWWPPALVDTYSQSPAKQTPAKATFRDQTGLGLWLPRLLVLVGRSSSSHDRISSYVPTKARQRQGGRTPGLRRCPPNPLSPPSPDDPAAYAKFRGVASASRSKYQVGKEPSSLQPSRFFFPFPCWRQCRYLHSSDGEGFSGGKIHNFLSGKRTLVIFSATAIHSFKFKPQPSACKF